MSVRKCPTFSISMERHISFEKICYFWYYFCSWKNRKTIGFFFLSCGEYYFLWVSNKRQPMTEVVGSIQQLNSTLELSFHTSLHTFCFFANSSNGISSIKIKFCENILFTRTQPTLLPRMRSFMSKNAQIARYTAWKILISLFQWPFLFNWLLLHLPCDFHQINFITTETKEFKNGIGEKDICRRCRKLIKLM